MSIVDEKRVKFTSFDSYIIYNVFCLTFRRNPQILIEIKILEAISRKNKGPTKPRTTNGNKAKDCMVVHYAAQPYCSHWGHARVGARQCVCQCVHARLCVCQCVGARPCKDGRAVRLPQPARFAIFLLFNAILFLFGGRPFVGFL